MAEKILRRVAPALLIQDAHICIDARSVGLGRTNSNGCLRVVTASLVPGLFRQSHAQHRLKRGGVTVRGYGQLSGEIVALPRTVEALRLALENVHTVKTRRPRWSSPAGPSRLPASMRYLLSCMPVLAVRPSRRG